MTIHNTAPVKPRDIRRAARMTQYVLHNLRNGVTGMKAKAGRFDLGYEILGSFHRQAFQIAQTTLAGLDIKVELGVGDATGANDYPEIITVTEVGGEPVQPTPDIAPPTSRDIRRGAKMAKYVLRNFQGGIDDVPAKTGRFNLAYGIQGGEMVDERVFQIAQGILAQAGLKAELYVGHSTGSYDYPRRISVTEIQAELAQP